MSPCPPQTSQGVQVRRFKTLSELIALYLQPNQGLVCTLLFPVERDKDKDPAEDRDYSGTAGSQLGPPSPGGEMGLTPRIAPLQMERTRSRRCRHVPAPPASPAAQGGSAPRGWGQRGGQRGEALPPRMSPACPCRLLIPWLSCPPHSTNGLSSISHEYLRSSYTLDLEAVKGGASSLPHLNKTLVASCKRLHRWVPDTGRDRRTDRRVFHQPSPPPFLLCSPHSEVDKVLGGLEILAKVFDQQSPPMVSKILQQVRGTQGHVVVTSPFPPTHHGDTAGGSCPSRGVGLI